MLVSEILKLNFKVKVRTTLSAVSLLSANCRQMAEFTTVNEFVLDPQVDLDLGLEIDGYSVEVFDPSQLVEVGQQ